MRCRFTAVAAVLCLLVLQSADARSPLRVPQTFSITNDVGFGNSVYVVGNHSDLGNLSPTGGVKLRWTSGNIWTGQAGVQAGTALQYKFVRRSTATAQICSTANSTDLGTMLFRSIPPQSEGPYSGKTILYHSTWPQAFILYRQGTNWVSAAMTRVRAGRTASENMFRVTGIGEAGEPLEFVPNDGSGQWDNPAGGGNYLTALDVCYLQDKQIFNYQPPPALSAPVIQTATVASSYGNIPGRTIRVYLPRGYTQNTWKRYPVLYFHDGQNVFDPGGPFGSWSADATATREISAGRMRECILAGIDNSPNRIPEYMPPTDSYSGQAGIGDSYRNYVTNNVFAHVNATYRTLTQPQHTLAAGSSLGGLISLYFGRETSAFGKIGVLSPAFWIAPNYMNQVRIGMKQPARVYLDMGTAEGESAWNNALSYYDTLLIQNYAINDDALFVTGCGDQHNEAAWKRRLPGVFRFLLSLNDEPNRLAQEEFPPRIELLSAGPPGGLSWFSFYALQGFRYELQQTSNFAAWHPSGSATSGLPWSQLQISATNPTTGAGVFWRLRAVPGE